MGGFGWKLKEKLSAELATPTRPHSLQSPLVDQMPATCYLGRFVSLVQRMTRSPPKYFRCEKGHKNLVWAAAVEWPNILAIIEENSQRRK